MKSQCDAVCRYGTDRSVLLKIARAYELDERVIDSEPDMQQPVP